MAKTAKMEDEKPAAAAKKFDKSTAVDVINEAIRLKTEQSEAAGDHGKHVASAIDRLGIDKSSFGFARKLHEMDAAKRQGVMRALLMLTDALGHFEQGDLLGGPVELMAEIAKRHDNSKPKTH